MAIVSQYRRETNAQAGQLLSGSSLVETPQGIVEVGQAGEGLTVLIAHGSLGGYDQGLWLAGLIGSGFHYLAPSRFGYLRSPLPSDPSSAAQARHYAALLDALQIEKAAVVGISAGGPSALQFALGYPERCRCLIMLSAISHPLTGMPWFLKALFFGLMKTNFLPWLLFRVSPDSVYQTNGVNRALLNHIRSDPAKMKLLRDLAFTNMLPALRRAGMMNDWQQATRMAPFPLAQITVPTLVIHAVNDPVVAFEFGCYSVAHIPGARLLEVEDGGHFCCVTHREKVVPALTQFLKTHLS